MNTIKAKLARLRIKSKGYYESRRQEMIRKAWDCEQNASWHFGDPYPGYYSNWTSKANMYRMRAGWYVRKQIESRK